MYYFFFFFQAEDGIRDTSVTGVQTCALPIYDVEAVLVLRVGVDPRVVPGALAEVAAVAGLGPCVAAVAGAEHRSEERRVGKECGARWGADEVEEKSESHS